MTPERWAKVERLYHAEAAVRGLFVADLFETTSNIWMASFADNGNSRAANRSTIRAA